MSCARCQHPRIFPIPTAAAQSSILRPWPTSWHRCLVVCFDIRANGRSLAHVGGVHCCPSLTFKSAQSTLTTIWCRQKRCVVHARGNERVCACTSRHDPISLSRTFCCGRVNTHFWWANPIRKCMLSAADQRQPCLPRWGRRGSCPRASGSRLACKSRSCFRFVSLMLALHRIYASHKRPLQSFMCVHI